MAKNSVFKGLFWKFLQTISNQGVTFVLSIILARLLLPSEYGLVAMVNIFIVFSNVFVVDGFSASLIQKKDADRLDFNSMFWSSLCVSGILYLILYILSPWISSLFNAPELCKILRVYSIILFFNSYKSIQYSALSKALEFKKQFYSTAIGGIGSGIIGIVLALQGCGVWALVAQALSNVILNNIVLTFIINWKPRIEFSFQRAKRLLSFGIKVLSSNMLRTISIEMRQFLIAKFYTPADLAIYNRGQSFPGFFYSNLTNVISSVLFPVMSNTGGDVIQLKRMIRTTLQVNSVCLFFLLGMLVVIAKPLVVILLTEKWIEAVPYLQIACVANIFSVLSNINIQVIKAMGKGNVLVKLELIKMPMFLILLIGGLYISLKAVALSAVIYCIYAACVNIIPTKQSVSYSIKQQMADICPALLIMIVSGCVSYFLNNLIKESMLTLLIYQSIIYTLVYLSSCRIFRVKGSEYICTKIKTIVSKHKKQ